MHNGQELGKVLNSDSLKKQDSEIMFLSRWLSQGPTTFFGTYVLTGRQELCRF